MSEWLLPRTPTGLCGQPRGGGPPTVRWHVVSVHRVKQIVSAPALAAHCPMKLGTPWPGPGRRTTPPGDRSSTSRRGRPASASTGRRPATSRSGASSADSVLDAVSHPATASGRSAARAEAWLPEATHVRGGRRERRERSCGGAGRLLPRRAARPPGRHRESRCGESRCSTAARRSRARGSRRSPRCPTATTIEPDDRHRGRAARTAPGRGSLPSARRRA